MGTARAKPDPVGVAFTEAVVEAFGYLDDLGFMRSREEPRLVRYESNTCFINIYQSRISNEIKLQIGRLEDSSEVFGVGAVEKAFGAPGYIGTGMTGDPEIVRRLVSRFAGRFRPYLTRAITGGTAAFERLRQARRESQDEFERRERLQSVRKQAERDRAAGDYAALIESYEAIGTDLTELEKKRLAYARSRMKRVNK